MARPPSGEQYELRLGDQHATVVEVGGAIREYRVGGRDVLHPFALDAMCDGAHGTPLVPWPNRLADGRYRFDGTAQQVPLTEPDKQNAIHGFLRWDPWQLRERTDRTVTVACAIHPRKGYPFDLDVEVRYELAEDGLTVTTVATNEGAATAPFACGQHPYLSPGDGLLDTATLQFAAATRIDTDPQRQLPVGRVPVAGTEFDFAAGRRIGAFAADFAFTDLERDDTGRAWVLLTGGDGLTVAFWAGSEYPVVELFTADTLAPDRRRTGLACEPMTAPPNAFATGESLIRLDPGASSVHTWGVGLRG